MASSDAEVTSMRERESSPSESSPGRRMRVSSPTTDPSLSSPTMASLTSSTMAPLTSSTMASHSSATIVPLTSSTMGPLTSLTMAPLTSSTMASLHSSSTMAGTQTVAGPSSTVPETVPETAQLQQEDYNAVQEADEENVQLHDNNIDPEAELENDQQQDGLYADNFGGKAVEEQPPAAPAQALRREILVRSQLVYQEFSQHVVDGTHVGAIFADECDSWLELTQRVRLLYDRVADRGAAAEDLTMWPGRVVWFYSRGVNGQMVERNYPQDDWVGLDLANNLFLVILELLPQGRVCRIVEGFADGTEEQHAQIVIHNFPTWLDFLASVRQLYYGFFLGEVAPALDMVISPFNCCPGAHVTFWGDLREQWFWCTNHRGNRWQLNWPAARRGICKVRIDRNNR